MWPFVIPGSAAMNQPTLPEGAGADVRVDISDVLPFEAGRLPDPIGVSHIIGGPLAQQAEERTFDPWASSQVLTQPDAGSEYEAATAAQMEAGIAWTPEAKVSTPIGAPEAGSRPGDTVGEWANLCACGHQAREGALPGSGPLLPH